MFSTRSLAAATAAFALIATSAAEYDPNGNGNTVVYWGSGANQLGLSAYCYDESIDIISIGFLNSFPAQADGLVGVSYSSAACQASPFYKGPGYAGNPPDPDNDVLWTNCPAIQQDLYDCQQNSNTKFLISLGGAVGNYQLNNASDGEYLANLLWGMYGPYNSSWTGIRPLDGGATGSDGTHIDIDGFDFDIEKTSPGNQSGYIKCIQTLRSLFAAYKAKYPGSKDYLITGAPQCPRPDKNMSAMIKGAQFDIVWPQFYNNGPANCTAREWVNGGSDFNYADWVSDITAADSASKDAKVYIGLLGGASGSSQHPGDYLTPTEAQKLIASFQSNAAFGGIMLWDAVSSNDVSYTGYQYANGTAVQSGAAYYDLIKNYLGAPLVPFTPTSSSASSTSTSSSITTSSAAVTTTSSAAATTTSVPVIPTHVPSVGSCTRIGCYTEGYNIRALTPFSTADYTDMSPEICGAACPGYMYFGVEYGGECYCGDQINNGSTVVDDSECSMPCDGNPGEYCGAGNRLDVYFCGSVSSSSSSSVAASTSSSTSSTAVTTSSVDVSSSSSTSSAAVTTSSAAPSSSSTSSSSSTGPITASACWADSPCQATESAIPACGAPWLQSAALAVGCAAGDFGCECDNFAAIEGLAAASVVSACTAPLDVLASANALCSCVTANPAPTGPCSTAISTTSSSSSVPTSSSVTDSSSSSSAAPTSSSTNVALTSSSSSSSAAASSSSAPTTTSSPTDSSTSSVPTSSINYSTNSSYSLSGTTFSSSSAIPTSSIDYFTNSSYSLSGITYSTSSTGTGSGSATVTSSSVLLTTSTVQTTITSTITSCAPTVTTCPVGSVTTVVVDLYTTVCPVTETQTPTTTSTEEQEYTTSTVFATTTYTITSCAPSVTDCPAKLGQVTTETIELYTTVCPVTATQTGGVSTGTTTVTTLIQKTGTVTVPSSGASKTTSVTTSSSTTTVYKTIVVVPTTATVAPYPVSVSAQAKALGTGTGLPVVSLITSTAAGAGTPTPTPSPISFKGAASSSRGPVGVIAAVVLGAVVFML